MEAICDPSVSLSSIAPALLAALLLAPGAVWRSPARWSFIRPDLTSLPATAPPRSRWATSTATAIPTWRSPTSSPAMSRCCWAAPAAASPARPTSPPAASPSRWRWATSTATRTPTWRSPTPSRHCLGAARRRRWRLHRPRPTSPPAPPSSVAVGDFNRDGDPDLAVADQVAGNVSVLLGGAAAASAARRHLAAGTRHPRRWRWATSTVTTIPTWRSPTVRRQCSVLLGSSGGQASAARPAGDHTGARPGLGGGGRLQPGRRSRPGRRRKVPRPGPGAARRPRRRLHRPDRLLPDHPLGLSSVAVGDFNRDGDPDLAVANLTSDRVSVLLGGAGGSFGARPTSPPAPSRPRSRWPTSTATASPTWPSPTPTSDNVSVLLNTTVTNQAPAAAADAYSTAEDTALTVAAPGVLGNDSDPDGDTAERRAGVGAGPRHPHPERRRLVHLHPGRQLQRHRHLHLPGQRRHRCNPARPP